MKFKFWGVRGSIPSPGPHTVRYGGNTTCIEVRSDAGRLIVLDAGTGIFALGQQLCAREKVEANIFITHSHWDHIHGLPFFTPLFRADSVVRLHGVADAISGQGIERVMAVQLQQSYFPVDEAQLAATLLYRTIAAGEPVAVGDALVRNAIMHHPVTDLGYRVECNGKALFFSGDYEPLLNPHLPGHPEHADAARQVAESETAIAAMAQSVDALIMDCSYTREEYASRRGWGHGTFDGALDLALRCGARRLYCTHHEPTRSDDELDAVLAELLARRPPPPGLEVHLAREGMEVELD